MLPAIQLDGKLITESDDILVALEQVYGPLGSSMNDVVPQRRLERLLFRAWCSWLCYPSRSQADEEHRKLQFQEVARAVEDQLGAEAGPYMLNEFGTADVVFIPYVERMNASLYYYKGFSLRDEHPRLGQWLDALETRETYRGTQSDFHTHAHDLPPQMGGCYSSETPEAKACQERVDSGPWEGLPEARHTEPETVKQEALHRVLKHREAIITVNPSENDVIDEALRCALTQMITGESPTPPAGSAQALRYLRDRISVPRDMSVYAARHLRTALEATASQDGTAQGTPIPTKNRYDQQRPDFVAA